METIGGGHSFLVTGSYLGRERFCDTKSYSFLPNFILLPVIYLHAIWRIDRSSVPLKIKKMHKTIEDNESAINHLFENSLKDFRITKDELFERLNFIVQAELNSGTIEWKESIFRKVMDVHQRLRLIDDLMMNKTNPVNKEDLKLNFQEYLDKTKLIRELNLFREILYPPLCSYLLITCFDQLGQNSEFVDFGTWVRSSKHEEEREKAISEIDPSISKLDFVKELQNKYNEIYGVTKSFRRFIREKLPQDFKSELLSQIKIEIYKGNLETFHKSGTDKEKEDWLMRIRNSYTHNTYSAQKHYVEGKKENEVYWELRESFLKSGGNQICLVYVSDKFFEQLKIVVKRGILELILNNSKIKKNGTECAKRQ